jgi:hypothetical protein
MGDTQIFPFGRIPSVPTHSIKVLFDLKKKKEQQQCKEY